VQEDHRQQAEGRDHRPLTGDGRDGVERCAHAPNGRGGGRGRQGDVDHDVERMGRGVLTPEAAAGADHRSRPQGDDDEGGERQVAGGDEPPDHRPAGGHRQQAQEQLGRGSGSHQDPRRGEPQRPQRSRGHRRVDGLGRAGDGEEQGGDEGGAGQGGHQAGSMRTLASSRFTGGTSGALRR